MRSGWGVAVAMMLSGACAASATMQGAGAPVYGYEVVNVYPHDPGAYTQGLLFRDGFLFESTGLNGRSSLRKVRLETGEVVQRQEIAAQYFAEGLAAWDDSLIQLTWVSNVGFVYDLQTFERRRTFSYAGEGWGLTHDGARLIMSDGSSSLRFLDPETFRETGRVEVRDAGRRIDQLNELEYIDGEVYANVWLTDRIVVIDPASGSVTRWLDLTGLHPGRERFGNDVLNGIAWDAAGRRLFVTGKQWPQLFEIRERVRLTP